MDSGFFPEFLKDAYKDKFIEDENWSRTNAEKFDFFENVRISSDSDYVTKALIKIKKHYPHVLDKTGATNKSRTKSNNTREKANELFKKKKWIEALKQYSKSIALAENQSKELGFAYANRSALLLHRGFYKECLEDIERALKLDYPADKKPQLVTRREKAEKLLPSQKKRILYEPPPLLPSRNSDLRCATEAIQVSHNKQYGRFIEATRDISPGEILLIEDPYALVTAQDFKTTHCGHCSKLCFNLIPCKGCSVEMYCSEICRNQAIKEYHQYECIVMNFYPPEIFDIMNIPVEERNINNINKEQIRQLSLRITLKGFVGYQSSFAVDAEDLYEDVGKLQTHRNDLSKSALMVLSFNLAKQYQILKLHTNFVSRLQFKDREAILKYHFLRNRLICCFNLATLQYKLDEEINHETKASPAIGLYTTYSLFNHSCVENVCYGFYGRTMVMRAIKKIKKGEQCFINYGHFYHDHPKMIRYANITRNYLFTCKCEACEKDWPTFNRNSLAKERIGFDSAAYLFMDTTKDMIEKDKMLDEVKRQRAFRQCEEIENMIKKKRPSFSLILLYNLVYLIVVTRYQGLDF